MRFLYVMKDTDRDKMISLGYKLIKTNTNNKVWIFENKNIENFTLEDALLESDISFVLSDILTF